MRLQRRPLHLLDLAGGGVRQYRIATALRQPPLFRQVPNQRLRIAASRANMAGAMRRPGDRVHGRLMLLQLRHRQRRHPLIQHHDLVAVHHRRRHVSLIMIAPPDPNQWRIRVRTLVNYLRMLLIAQIKNPNRSVAGDGGEDVGAAPGDVVDVLVVRDQLRLDGFALHIPNRARRVDARRRDSPRHGGVPVKRRQRAGELAAAVGVESALELDALPAVVVGEAPEAEEVGGGGEEVRVLGFRVGHEGELGGRVRVVEGEVGVGPDLSRRVVELDYFDPVLVAFE